MRARAQMENGAGPEGRGRTTGGRPRRVGPIVAPSAPSGPGGRLITRLLRVPLFYKILLANAVLVVVVAVAGPILAVRMVRAWPELEAAQIVAVIAFTGVVVSLVVNAVILRVALSPLWSLEQTAARVQAGELEARAPLSIVADRDLERLVVTFNGMLDSSASYRRRLQEIAARALTAAEEERKRLSRELHDSTAQSLAALRIRLRLARAAKSEEQRQTLLAEISEEIGAATEEVRRMAYGLRPPALDMLGLAPAIESHARGLAEATGLSVDIDLTPVSGELTPEAELALYRVVQEALSNVVRHADATGIRIQLRRRAGFIEAMVEDDGRGFLVEDVTADGERSLGLFGMRERAAYVGGSVEIKSKPGEGTRVRITIPRVETETHV